MWDSFTDSCIHFLTHQSYTEYFHKLCETIDHKISQWWFVSESCGFSPFGMVPSLVMGNLLSLKQKTKLIANNISRNLIGNHSFNSKKNFTYEIDVYTTRAVFSTWLSDMLLFFISTFPEKPDRSEDHWVRLSLTSWEGSICELNSLLG